MSDILENIHSLFIHFPIALLSTGLFFDIMSHFFNKEDLEISGLYCMIIGTFTCITSNLTGFYSFINMYGDPLSIIQWQYLNHVLMGWGLTIYFILLILIRFIMDVDFYYSTYKKRIYFVLHILGVSVLFYSAHLGAKAAERI